MKLKAYAQIYPWTTAERPVFNVYNDMPTHSDGSKIYAVEFEVPDPAPAIKATATEVTDWEGGEKNAY
jgi:hypothetical protein